MDSELNSTVSQAHPETMDILSRAWCQFAVQAFQPQVQDRSVVLDRNSSMSLNNNPEPSFLKMNTNTRMDDTRNKSVTPLQLDDIKSWVWMQQAMHQELNYHSYFHQKKSILWNVSTSIKNVRKWLKEIKQRSKEIRRLQRAEVHAAISIAGLAAALAAIAAENSKHNISDTMKESAVASAAAIVAAQCAKVAEEKGARKGQVSSVIGSATTGTSVTDILTVTAAATSSLRGAAMLKNRGYGSQLNWRAPVTRVEDNSDFTFNFSKSRLVLAKGTELNVESPDGRCSIRSVSIVLSRGAKVRKEENLQVILRIKKPRWFNAFVRTKENVVRNLHTEMHKESKDRENDLCYLLVLITNDGTVKLHMEQDYRRYKTWSMTINHMLMLSTS